jgi:glyoxylase-like metal-dependent hydrolase (beta-lactamase superfamily II)
VAEYDTPFGRHPVRCEYPRSLRETAKVRSFMVGDAQVTAIEDGTFFMASDALSGHLDPGTDECDEQGRARLPVHAFLVRDGDRNVLVDAGMGSDPERTLDEIAVQLNFPRERMSLVGNASLLEGLRACEVEASDINAVVVSHLHVDHIGWLTDPDGGPSFANATMLIPRADYENFVVGMSLQLPVSMRESLRALADAGRVELFDGEILISRALTAIPAPGHTPGHTVFAVAAHGERAMILGDAMYCSAQITSLDVGAMHDIDPVLARRTREMIARDAEAHETRVIGCHFVGGRTARLVDGRVVLA